MIGCYFLRNYLQPPLEIKHRRPKLRYSLKVPGLRACVKIERRLVPKKSSRVRNVFAKNLSRLGVCLVSKDLRVVHISNLIR